MKKGKHTEEQIIGVLKQVEAGRTVKEMVRSWASARRRSTPGRASTAAWKLVKSAG